MMDLADFWRGKVAIKNEGDISENLKDSSVKILTTKDVKKICNLQPLFQSVKIGYHQRLKSL